MVSAAFGATAAQPKQIDNDPFHPDATWVVAREIEDAKPGSSIEVNADETAYPKPFSSMPAGDYEAQAVLDVGHTYNYGGRVPEDVLDDVLELIARGLTNTEIAGQLAVSEATVKSHINHVFAKIGARDRAQAVHYAYTHGLAG